jgi:eukaryotic-like serine/threonine-protein kinase
MTSPPRLRGYAVERWLGSGATSDVWQARASTSGALVAVKRIRLAGDERLARARAEATLLGALDHPNLVRLHDLIESDDAVVLVLDLAAGGSLADLLVARGRLTPGEVITAVAPVAVALAYLHDAGVVHGDVSAANVLFAADGVPLLADVGVARLTGDERDAEANPAYVDPAVAAGAVPGPPSDVFMLGAVALHALTGRPPWPPAGSGAVDTGALDRVRHRLAVAAVPEPMAVPVARALAADPQRRGTAADLALDLAHSGTAVAVDLAAGRVSPGPAGEWTGPRHAARPPGDPPPTRLVARARPVIPRPPPRRSRRLPVLVGLAVAGLAGCAGIVWASIGTAQERPQTATASGPRPQVETSPRSSGRPTTTQTARAVPAARHPDWPAELDRLDALRARAFAERRPALLRQVYPPGSLRAADTASLLRLVPPGCRLHGVRTHYAAAHLAEQGRLGVITATATIAASRLTCPGRTTASAPAAHARLRIVLEQSPAGVLIVSERALD